MSGRERTSAPLVLRVDVDAIAVLTLNRPQARNSLSEALIAAPADQLTAIAADRSGAKLPRSRRRW